MLKFDEPVDVTCLRLMFQGGFVGQDCAVEVTVEDGEKKGKEVAVIDPDDTNLLQISSRSKFVKMRLRNTSQLCHQSRGCEISSFDF